MDAVCLCGDGAVSVVFKKKTAYELRMSDWTSDVCSSDLGGDQRARSTERAMVPAAIVPLVLSALVVGGLSRGSMPMAWVGAVGVLVYGLLAIFGMGLSIGSASCRERVCQYV